MLITINVKKTSSGFLNTNAFLYPHISPNKIRIMYKADIPLDGKYFNPKHEVKKAMNNIIANVCFIR